MPEPRTRAPRRDEVLRVLTARCDDLARQHVEALWLFGSVARDEAEPESDIDLLVEFNQRPSFREWSALHDYLESCLGFSVDLVERPLLKSRIRSIVESEAIRAA